MKLRTVVTLLLPLQPHDQWHTFQPRVRLRFGGPSSAQGGQHHVLTSSSGGNTYFPRAPGPLNKGFKIQVSMLALFLGNWTPSVLGVILRRGPPHFEEGASPGKQKNAFPECCTYFHWVPHWWHRALWDQEDELHFGNLLTSLHGTDRPQNIAHMFQS